MLPDWFTPAYLLAGDHGQQEAYEVLKELQIMHILREYTPVLTGTFPLQLQIEQSDLDVICEVYDFISFEQILRSHFGSYPDFTLNQLEVSGHTTLIANFTHRLPIEIFAQPVPVMKQNAYRHMVVEARLLALGGETATQAIRELKQSGLKTEPAFAQYFGIAADNPYEKLLKLECLTDEELKAELKKSGIPLITD